MATDIPTKHDPRALAQTIEWIDEIRRTDKRIEEIGEQISRLEMKRARLCDAASALDDALNRTAGLDDEAADLFDQHFGYYPSSY